MTIFTSYKSLSSLSGHQSVCFTLAKMNNDNKDKKENSIVSTIITIVIVVAMVFIGRSCGEFFGKKAAESKKANIEEPRKSYKTNTFTESKVKSNRLEEFSIIGLYIDLPGMPTKRTVPIPDAVKANMVSKDSYLYQDGIQTISISRDVFLHEFNFQDRCDLAYRQFKSVDSRVSQKSYTVDGVAGKCFTFDAGQGAQCTLLVFSRGTTLWQVQVMDDKARSRSTRELSDSIFSSINLSS